MVVPRKEFKVTKGKPKNWAATADSGKKNDHFFCGGAFPLIPRIPFLLAPQRISLESIDTSFTTHPSVCLLDIDCGSGLYTELEVMPDAVCVKSGSIDDKKVRDFDVGVEFYTKDRLGYCAPQKDAKQERVFG